MIQSKIYPQCWEAEEGKTFKRKANGAVVGKYLSLGKKDSIENYEEVELLNENDYE